MLCDRTGGQRETRLAHLLGVELNGTFVVLESAFEKQGRSDQKAVDIVCVNICATAYSPLLHQSGEFSDAAALLAKNLLGVGGTDLEQRG